MSATQTRRTFAVDPDAQAPGPCGTWERALGKVRGWRPVVKKTLAVRCVTIEAHAAEVRASGCADGVCVRAAKLFQRDALASSATDLNIVGEAVLNDERSVRSAKGYDELGRDGACEIRNGAVRLRIRKATVTGEQPPKWGNEAQLALADVLRFCGGSPIRSKPSDGSSGFQARGCM